MAELIWKDADVGSVASSLKVIHKSQGWVPSFVIAVGGYLVIMKALGRRSAEVVGFEVSGMKSYIYMVFSALFMPQ